MWSWYLSKSRRSTKIKYRNRAPAIKIRRINDRVGTATLNSENFSLFFIFILGSDPRVLHIFFDIFLVSQFKKWTFHKNRFFNSPLSTRKILYFQHINRLIHIVHSFSYFLLTYTQAKIYCYDSIFYTFTHFYNYRVYFVDKSVSNLDNPHFHKFILKKL